MIGHNVRIADRHRLAGLIGVVIQRSAQAMRIPGRTDVPWFWWYVQIDGQERPVLIPEPDLIALPPLADCGISVEEFLAEPIEVTA
jgi:hypothetical protein